MTRIAGIDPGMQKDSFALVVIETEDKKIKVKSAFSWRGKSYLEVENRIAELHNDKPCDYYIVEQNNTGIHVIENLRHNHNIPNIIPVFTSKNIKEPDKHPHTMDKNEMVRWMLTKKEKKELEYPQGPIVSKHIQELKRQMSNFGEQKTGTGSVRYSAPSGEHDDYVMALMLGCWWAKKSSIKHASIIAERLSSKDNIDQLNEENDQGLTGLRWERK